MGRKQEVVGASWHGVFFIDPINEQTCFLGDLNLFSYLMESSQLQNCVFSWCKAQKKFILQNTAHLSNICKSEISLLSQNLL